jgi:hypothetical protein
VPTFHFQLCGLPVSLSTSSSSLFQLYADYFRYYPRPLAKPAAASLQFRLQIRNSPPPDKWLPAEAELLSHVGQVRFWRHPQREQFYLQTATTLFRVDPQRGRTVGLLSEAALHAPNLLANTYTFVALLLLLRWHARYHLHTAAVVSPREQLHLICGGQRAGKTTLTTALGVSGWQPISDDGVLLQANEQGKAQMVAFKRDFHIATELLQHWPALQHVPSRHAYFDRSCIDGLRLFKARALADQPFTRVERVLFPIITGEPESHLEPLPPSEALRQLIEQSVFFPLWPQHTARQMQLLTALMKDTAFYRLHAGTDIWANPQRAVELLAA